MHLLGFRFAQGIHDLADRRLYIECDAKLYPTLGGLIGSPVNLMRIRSHCGTRSCGLQHRSNKEL